MDNHADPTDPAGGYTDRKYALSGKIMLSAIVILFFVVILMVCLHLYARWYLLRARRRQLRRNRHRRTQLVFYVDPENPNPATAAASRGLEASLLKSLPVFVYSSKTYPDSMDCAVCLSEFEENESGRVLPKCNHRFHIECIDMWFHSHSTCPLCRSPVEPGQDVEAEVPTQVVISVTEPGSGSGSGFCDTCQHEGNSVGTSSLGDRRKRREFVGVSIDVPRRNYNEGFEDESTRCDTPASQNPSSFRSPMSRMLSLKRILSRDRRGNSSPSSGNVASCESVTELENSEPGVEANRQSQV